MTWPIYSLHTYSYTAHYNCLEPDINDDNDHNQQELIEVWYCISYVDVYRVVVSRYPQPHCGVHAPLRPSGLFYSHICMCLTNVLEDMMTSQLAQLAQV